MNKKHIIERKSEQKLIDELMLKDSLSSQTIANPLVRSSTDWNSWLSEYEANLKELGYRKFNQNHKNEDFCYWKTFKNGEDKIYQIGLLFYDFRKYADRDPMANRISVMYQCMLLCDDRIDMDVSKDIDLPEFELMAKTFYEAMSQYCR